MAAQCQGVAAQSRVVAAQIRAAAAQIQVEAGQIYSTWGRAGREMAMSLGTFAQILETFHCRAQQRKDHGSKDHPGLRDQLACLVGTFQAWAG